MDVNRSEPLTPVAKREPRNDQRPRHDGEDDDQSDENANHHDGDSWRDEDAVAFEGALSGSLTPEVQKALEALASRLEPMREDLERARERESDLRRQLERHPYLPVLNRSGLEHEVARIAGRLATNSDALSVAPVFLCVSICSAPGLRRQYGRTAYDQAMTAACGILKSCFSENDIFGCLGGDDLGVIVFGDTSGTGDVSIEQLVAKVNEAFERQAVDVDGYRLILKVDVGGSSLHDHITFASAMAAADAHLMQSVAA